MKPFIFSLVLCCVLYSNSLWSQDLPPARDTLRTRLLDEWILTGNRQEENFIKAPVSIERLTLKSIGLSAQPGFFEAIQNLKGVQVITPSLGFRVINARGFGHTTNVRFAQLVDGVDNQAPHIGAAIGNSLGPNDLDILSVEIIPGSASALHGMNAINGIAQFITKNPFDFSGVSFQQKLGMNHVNSADSERRFFHETNFRIAEVWKKKWGFKINGTLQTGMDWFANNSQDPMPKINSSANLIGATNPGADQINQYGDEASNRKTLKINGIRYVISRTGYAEKEVTDYSLKNLKGDASLYYRPTTNLELAYTFRATNQNTLYQRTNRFRFDNYQTQQHVISFQSPTLQFKTYLTRENTGDSYNIRSMAENIDRSFKSDAQWFSDFGTYFSKALAEGSSLANALQSARNQSDQGRIQPGSAEMQSKIAALRNINNWDQGAALRVKANLVHAELQQNLSQWIFPKTPDFYLMYGLDFRAYYIVPDGNYFINPRSPDENLGYWKTGGFIQASRTFLEDRLKVNAVLRVEKNQYFEPKLNPRLALNYNLNQHQHIRFSVQRGYRFPSIFEGFSNINSGGRRRVGGLPIMSSGIFENSYTQASIIRYQRTVQESINLKGLSLNQAVATHQGLLAKTDYSFLQPEQVKSVELGYRGDLAKGKLVVDADLYLNSYQNLIAQLDVNIPLSSKPDSLGYYFLQNSTQKLYRMWTNSKTQSLNYGGSVGLTYSLYRDYQVGGNFTYAKLSREKFGDGLEDGFNTPSWAYNLSLSKLAGSQSIGFQINYRQQAGFQWESALASGWLEGYGTLDLQVSKLILKEVGSLKIGATNALNRYYYSYLGGPKIGGFYYSTLTLNW